MGLSYFSRYLLGVMKSNNYTLRDVLEEFAPEIEIKEGEFVLSCVFGHPDEDPSLHINCDGEGKFKCFSCNSRGGSVQFFKSLCHPELDFEESLKALFRESKKLAKLRVSLPEAPIDFSDVELYDFEEDHYKEKSSSGFLKIKNHNPEAELVRGLIVEAKESEKNKSLESSVNLEERTDECKVSNKDIFLAIDISEENDESAELVEPSEDCFSEEDKLINKFSTDYSVLLNRYSYLFRIPRNSINSVEMVEPKSLLIKTKKIYDQRDLLSTEDILDQMQSLFDTSKFEFSLPSQQELEDRDEDFISLISD